VKNIVRRTTLIVRDVERSARWYEQVVGMTRWHEGEVVLSGEGLAAGKKGDRTGLIIMQCEHPDIGMIGLLQWLDPPLPAPKEIPKSVTYGNPTFVCASDDCREVLRRAQEQGTHIHAGPHEWSVMGPGGVMRHFVSVSVFDPDGYFYEFNQALP
jgi:catechol 2,3-dioxygenase-like lactoylglutathione lyase family enzyme